MIPKLFLSCTFSIMVMACVAQAHQNMSKDQILREFEKNLPDSTRQKLCNRVGEFFISQPGRKKINIDSAFYYLRKSVYMIDSANFNNNLITNESLCLLAEAYFKTENLPEGEKIFMQVILNYQKAGDKAKEARTWYREGLKLFYLEVDVDGIESSLDHALNIYIQTGDILKKIDVVLDLANFHFRLGNSPLAQKELVNLIKDSKGNLNYKLSNIYLKLSFLKRYAGDFDEGLGYALNAVKSMEQSNDTTGAHEFYGELALEYQELDQPENSIYWYKKCIAERVRMNMSQFLIYRTTYLMAVQMIKVRKEKEALDILRNLEKTKPPNGPVENAILVQSLAYCYNAMRKYSLAEKYFLIMIKDYSGNESNGEMLCIANYDIGQFYVSLHMYSKAEPYLKEAFAKAISTTLSRVKDLHLLMFKVDSAKGNYTAAIEHLQKYKSLSDSIFNEKKSKDIEELMIKYEVEKKDKNIQLFEKQSMVQQGKLTQIKTTRNWIIGVVALMVIIISLLANYLRLKQQTNKKLEVQQKEIRKQNVSLQHLVKEKDWLVKEIHHRVKNNFHIVNGLLATQIGYLKNEEAINAVGESQHRVQAMSLIHQKLYQSERFSAIDMSDYIRELVDYLRESFNISKAIQFRLDIESVELDLSRCVPLGLILNEAITNAIKYAFGPGQKGVISISLGYGSPGQLLLVVSDNGIGLPPGFNIDKCNSMGMILMKGLSEDMEGTFSINSHSGTEIRVAFIYDPVAMTEAEPINFGTFSS